MSRRVLPVCGSMCVCCPALRARSRQPVKRYNMLLADIYPKAQVRIWRQTFEMFGSSRGPEGELGF